VFKTIYLFLSVRFFEVSIFLKIFLILVMAFNVILVRPFSFIDIYFEERYV